MRANTLLVMSLSGILAFSGADTALARESSHAEIQRGHYLVDAGDCAACHTNEGGKPFAGGRPIPTPFGTMYATNITPDKQTGVGGWTDEQFWEAMHNGKAPDRYLFPAFPYPWYTKLTREDVLAIRSYLNTLKAVHQENKPPEFPWVLRWRGELPVWNALFFDPGTYQPDPNKSQQWNRGAYLVEGLGHCGACHTPKNFLGAVKASDRFEGGRGEGWFANSLTGNKQEGLGSWSVDEIIEYLKTGANDRTRAYGPMAEVVQHSTHRLTDADLRAIATYLKDLPGDKGNEPKPQQASSDHEALARGKLVYLDQCSGCHMENGEGLAGVFPPLKNSAAVHAHDPQSLVKLVLKGASSVRTPAKPEGFAMPGFRDKLSDAEIADVLTYLRASFGNQAASVSASQVSDVRRELLSEMAKGQ